MSFTVGREAISVYKEPSAGVRATGPSHNVFFNPYVISGNPASGTISLVDATPPGAYGTGDKRIQAYTYRICITNRPESRVPFEAPAGYDPG